MSLSLRDQLLQAGLITKKQADNAARAQRPPKTPQQKAAAAPTVNEEARRAAEAARAAKKAQDDARNRALQEKAEQKAKRLAVKQLVDEHKLPKVAESELLYNFVDGTKIRRLPVTAEQRAQLIDGRLDIARCDGRYELVPPAIAERIRGHDERAVIPRNSSAASSQPAEDDPYKDYVVPDDLMW